MAMARFSSVRRLAVAGESGKKTKMTKDQRRVMEPAKIHRIRHPAMLPVILPRP
jgi:hypothetical protein